MNWKIWKLWKQKIHENGKRKILYMFWKSWSCLVKSKYSFRFKCICYFYELCIFDQKFYNINQSNLVLQFQFHLRKKSKGTKNSWESLARGVRKKLLLLQLQNNSRLTIFQSSIELELIHYFFAKGEQLRFHLNCTYLKTFFVS